jgi:lysophospholipase L1-like esterase
VSKKLISLILLITVLIFNGCKIKKVQLQDRAETPLTIVILGSSTAAGTGPEEIANAWVNRYLIHAQGINPNHRIINLAKGGYTTYHLMPWEHEVPEGRPKSDPSRCITMALHLNPSAIIINLPSNDASYGYAVAEQLDNYDVILAQAEEQDVPVWITTTQPRNLSSQGRENLLAMRDSTFARLGEMAIDFWTDLAQPDGRIDSVFDCGDGVHLNDVGHEILFQRVVDAGILSALTGERRPAGSSP